MKKLAFGCLGVVVLIGIAVVGVGYYGYLRVKSTVSQFAELGRIPEIESGVRIKTAFIPPKSGELTQAQIDHLVQVQERVKQRLGQNMAVMERTYHSLLQKKDATIVDAPALLAAYRDLAAAWLDAKRTQVEALNDAGLSLDEYRWIRSEAYRSLEIPLVDIDFARIARDIKNGVKESTAVSLGGAFSGQAVKANLPRLQKYRKQLEDNLPFAAFGL
jgi:hypothetical protein